MGSCVRSSTLNADHRFTMDSGNSVGEVSGHSSIPNAVAIKAQRPFRAATAGDDCTVVFYHGAPYKYNKSSRKHSKFVYDVKFSPDGSKLVSVGADAKIFVYDGKTGDNIMELVDANNGHKGSVFAVSWDASSKYIVTSSADQTVKVWDVESGKVLQTWQLSESSNVGGQQVGNIWIDDTIISLSLSGRLTYLARGSDKPTRVVNGHQKAITALTITKDLSTMYSGSYDASAYVWSDSYQASELTGATHTSQILHIAAGKDTVMSIGMDDTAKLISGSEIVASVSTGDQPKGVAYMKDDVYVIATTSTIQICAGAKRENDIKPDYQPSACAANDQYIAIGSENSTIYIYDTKLQEQKQLKTNRSAITALAISPDSKHLAAGDSSGKIILYSLETGDPVTTRWAFHVNRITALSFSPSGKKVVSASLDTNIYVWFIDQLSKKLVVKNAHQGGVTGAVWKSETDVISSGSDGSLKLWSAMS